MISIITVCHRSYDLLQDFVGSFLQHHEHAGLTNEIEFVLVENSGDQRITEHANTLSAHGFATRLKMTENRGFGAGCNVGANLAAGDILIFANPDIKFMSHLGSARHFFERHSWGTVRQIGDSKAAYCFDLLPEHRGLLTEALRMHHQLHRFRSLWRFCYPVGSFFVVRKDLFLSVGGFDERFFLYYEEAELSRRLLRVVGPPKLLNEVVIWHKGMGTQPSSNFALEEEVKSFLLYCKIIGLQSIARRRLAVLRILSLVSRTAGVRARSPQSEHAEGEPAL